MIFDNSVGIIKGHTSPGFIFLMWTIYIADADMLLYMLKDVINMCACCIVHVSVFSWFSFFSRTKSLDAGLPSLYDNHMHELD